jgi:hypothetical protein
VEVMQPEARAWTAALEGRDAGCDSEIGLNVRVIRSQLARGARESIGPVEGIARAKGIDVVDGLHKRFAPKYDRMTACLRSTTRSAGRTRNGRALHVCSARPDQHFSSSPNREPPVSLRRDLGLSPK